MKILYYVLLVYVFVSYFLATSTNALFVSTQNYTSIEAFEQAEGKSCLSATDGCNAYLMSEDGKVMGGTKIYCENSPAVWSCATQKDDGMTQITNESIDCWDATDSSGNLILDEITGKPVLICPDMTVFQDAMGDNVCSTSFMWVASKSICMKSGEENLLSDNDWEFLASIEKQLNDTQKQKVVTITRRVNTFIEKFSEKKQERLRKKLEKIIEVKISSMLVKYPQDTSLPLKVDILYKTLTFLKFHVILGR